MPHREGLLLQRQSNARGLPGGWAVLVHYFRKICFVIFMGPPSLLRFEHLIFLFLLLVDLLFSLDLLLSLYLWGLFPLSVLNICYFRLLLPRFVILATFVIFVILVGPPFPGYFCFSCLLISYFPI